MIWRTHFWFNLDVLFYQQCMWFNHKRFCLKHSAVFLNIAFLFSRSPFIQFNLLLKLAEYCTQNQFKCLNKMKRPCCFLCIDTISLFCWIELTSDYKGKLKFLYLSSNVEKLKYISSFVIDDVQFHLLQNVICSSQSLYDEIQIEYSDFIQSGNSQHAIIISSNFKSSGIVEYQAVYSTSSIHQSFNGNFLKIARLS